MIVPVSSDHGPRLDRSWFVEAALAGERLAGPPVRVLGPGEQPGAARVLLVRPAGVALAAVPFDLGPDSGRGVVAGTLDAIRLAPPHDRLARLEAPLLVGGRDVRELLVEAVRRELAAAGVDWLLAAADEDGEDLGWYRGHGFQDLVRVSRC
jgi:hypothetical protein